MRRAWSAEDHAELDRLVAADPWVSPGELARRFGRGQDAMSEKLKSRYGARRSRPCLDCGKPIIPDAKGGRPAKTCDECFQRAVSALSGPNYCNYCKVEIPSGRRACDSCKTANRRISQRRWYLNAKRDPAWVARRALMQAYRSRLGGRR